MQAIQARQLDVFAIIGNPCSVCGKQPELTIALDMDENRHGSLQWRCHTIRAILDVENVDRDEVKQIGTVIKARKGYETIPDKTIKLTVYTQTEEKQTVVS